LFAAGSLGPKYGATNYPALVGGEAGSGRPDRERQDAGKEAVAGRAVFAGALDEREEGDEEGKRAERAPMPVQRAKTPLRSVSSPAAASITAKHIAAADDQKHRERDAKQGQQPLTGCGRASAG
jgi:hypothetical protein